MPQLSKDFVEVVDAIVAFDIESDLIRTDQLGSEHDFSSSAPMFRGIQELFREVRKVSLEHYPDIYVKTWTENAGKLRTELHNIKNYSPGGTYNSRNRGQIAHRLELAYSECLKLFGSAIAIDVIRRFGTDEANTWKERIVKDQRQATEIVGELTQLRNEADLVVSRIRTAVSERGAWIHAGHFEGEAERHRKSRRIWLGGAVCLGLGVITVALLRIGEADAVPAMTMASAIQMNVPWLMLFTVLSFGLVWCGRGYRGASHNWIVNAHRANALTTFREFLEGTENNSTKDAVLLHAAQCVFSHQPSGFSDPKQEPAVAYAPLSPLSLTGRQD